MLEDDDGATAATASSSSVSPSEVPPVWGFEVIQHLGEEETCVYLSVVLQKCDEKMLQKGLYKIINDSNSSKSQISSICIIACGAISMHYAAVLLGK